MTLAAKVTLNPNTTNQPTNHFHQIQNWHLQSLSVWKSLNFVIWERAKGFPVYNSLTIYHAIPTFNDPQEESC